MCALNQRAASATLARELFVILSFEFYFLQWLIPVKTTVIDSHICIIALSIQHNVTHKESMNMKYQKKDWFYIAHMYC